MFLNWVDLLFIIILIWAVRTSLDLGVVREAFSIAGLIVGTMLAGQLYRPFATMLFGPAPSNLAYGVTFVAVVVAIWFGANFIGRLLHETIHWIRLGWADRLGGLLFGAIKGILLIEVLMVILARFPVLGTEESVQKSLIVEWITRYTPTILGLLPSDFQRMTKTILR